MSNVKNNVQLIGHMGADPEVRTLENGTKMTRIRLATTERYKNKLGAWQDETTWHSIVAWEGVAEKAEKFLKKGAYILLEGKLTSRHYTSTNNEKKFVYEVRATNFILLDKKELEKNAMHNAVEKEEVLPF